MTEEPLSPTPSTNGAADAVWIVIGAVFAIIAEAYALFAGDYVPYVDWSNHLGLIAIFGHGESMGALEFAERSVAPRPYLLFYALSGLLSFVVSVPAAAKWTLVFSAGLSVVAMGILARLLGRPVIVAWLAPLALYGYARGYGFSSFVFAIGLLWVQLACFEWLLVRARVGRPILAPAVAFASALTACYLGHALWVLPASIAVAVRFFVFVPGVPTAKVKRAFVATATATVPALVCAAVAWTDLEPDRAGVASADAAIFVWGTSLWRRWSSLGGALLERGSPSHWLTMYGIAALFVALGVAHVGQWLRRKWRGERVSWSPSDRGALVYGVFFGLLYVVGPESVGWPMGVWMVYPRYASVGAVALFLLPRPKLSGGATAVVAAAVAVLVAHNAHLNHQHVARFSGWASRYDAVRVVIPPKATVLALTSYDPGDWIAAHPALGSLFFYHLCDGAAYTAFLFDNPLHPVRMKPERPVAPAWNRTSDYRPERHGVAFDYLVLRGRRFVEATRNAGLHTVVFEHAGWVVFRTKRPPKSLESGTVQTPEP